MKTLLLSAAIAFGLLATPSLAAVQFSTSGTDAGQGNSLSLQVGQSGSLFVWVSTDAGQTIAGIGADILSDNAAVLEGTAYIMPNPASRWAGEPTVGALGDLVTGSNAFALPGIVGTGISTAGQNDFVLFSEIQFSATAEGSANVSIAANANGFGDSLGNDLSGQFAGVGAVVNVTAVPEPSSAALLTLALGGVFLRRRSS